MYENYYVTVVRLLYVKLNSNKRAMQKHSSFYIFDKCAPEAVSKTETHPGVT